MSVPLRLTRYLVLTITVVAIASQSSLAFGPVDDALGENAEDCFDGIGLSFSDGEFDEALALGGQDESEFKMSRYACGSYDLDGRYEHVQCSERRMFESFSAANVNPDGWVICIVAMLIEDDGRGFRASLQNYDAILASGDVVLPDPTVSGWAGNHEEVFDVDISSEEIVSAGSLGYGLLAFPNMPEGDFLVRNIETGNQFVVIERETAIGDLIPIVAAPEVGSIRMTGNEFGSSLWILSLGHPLRVTFETKVDEGSGFGGIVSLDVEYRRDAASILPESEGLITADVVRCPPCEYSQTVEFTPDPGKVFHFTVLADGPWTIMVETVE